MGWVVEGVVVVDDAVVVLVGRLVVGGAVVLDVGAVVVVGVDGPAAWPDAHAASRRHTPRSHRFTL